MFHDCACSTFGGTPHSTELRHPNPRACEHSEWPDHAKFAYEQRRRSLRDRLTRHAKRLLHL